MLIGRKKEIERLNEYLGSNRSEFIALLGRRRIGKTYLIRQTFNNSIFFEFTGQKNISNKEELKQFAKNINEKQIINNWNEAFDILKDKIIQVNQIKKKIIFFDEISWICKQKSNFISALAYFWNDFCSRRNDVLLIICGSAISWIIDNILENRDELHNRLTGQIFLSPLNLKECEDYFNYLQINYSRYDIVETYMILGGIPYYLDYFRKGLSVAENIDEIIFRKKAPLQNEYNELFNSLFKNSEQYKIIIETLADNYNGLTQTELARKLRIVKNGNFVKKLRDLEMCGFLIKQTPFNKKKKDTVFQLIDSFSVFYLTFIKDKNPLNEFYWQSKTNSPSIAVWRGYAFERVCFLHINQIKKALNIYGVLSNASSFRDEESQIDLVIQREDRIINLCEIKFTKDIFEIDKDYYEKLRKRLNHFENMLKTKRTVHLTMITSFGLQFNKYSSIINSKLTMENLFLD
ncbi:MAG: ATP-binding protein [Bacillales bacterium]|jgi:AAA+ ATPase superfamily predicted ATPase|nr:ATP-binding protein [Bacillales bacterium]